MTVNALETNLRAIEEIFEVKKIPDLEYEEGEIELNLGLYQMEEE